MKNHNTIGKIITNNIHITAIDNPAINPIFFMSIFLFNSYVCNINSPAEFFNSAASFYIESN